jgi:3-oxoadipate enol-lactonase
VFVSIAGRRIRYDLIGPTSAPVVCLAHCLSADSGVWSEQIGPLLAAGRRVLALDMRGHGGSDPGPAGVTMAELAGDVVAVLDALGIAKVHLVGLSIGGMLAQCFALDHPERLHSLFLTGTSPQAVPGGQAMWDARFAAITAAGSLDPIADDTIRRWFTSSFTDAARMRQIRDTVAATSPAGYRAGAEAIIAFDVLGRLPNVRTPTLVVCGDDDPGTPPAGNRLIAQSIPGARYTEIADARHLPMVQHPVTFARILHEWLDAQSA